MQVFVHGAHGTKCYIVLRGLARILQPEEDARTGVIHYRAYADIGPGDVSVACFVRFSCVWYLLCFC